MAKEKRVIKNQNNEVIAEISLRIGASEDDWSLALSAYTSDSEIPTFEPKPIDDTATPKQALDLLFKAATMSNSTSELSEQCQKAFEIITTAIEK